MFGLLFVVACGGDVPHPVAGPLHVLTHGQEAQRLVAELGAGLVRCEPLVAQRDGDHSWENNSRRAGRGLPAAFVADAADAPCLACLWGERLGRQGGVRVVSLPSAGRAAENRRIDAVHALLLQLCPDARALLDARRERLLAQPKARRAAMLAGR